MFGLVAALIFFINVPLFHLVPLKAKQQQTAESVFNAQRYVDVLWQKLLGEASNRAIDVTELMAALQKNPESAAQQFGYRLGIGSNTAFFARGSGEVSAISDESITIRVSAETPFDLVIELGPVFSNSIRDGSGLLNISDFTNTQHFNAISSDINRRVEEQVLPTLQQAAQVGMQVHFTGGIEVATEDGPLTSLTLVPVLIEWL